MLNSLKTEAKTIMRMRSVYICCFVLIAISVYYLANGYSSAAEFAQQATFTMNEVSQLAQGGETVDYANVEQAALDVYKTYHPAMTVNNSLGIFIGIGIIVIPIISALYTGIEYSRNRVIKYKITHSSLTKTYISKITVMSSAILVIIGVYLLVCALTSWICWDGVYEKLASVKLVDYSVVTFSSVWDNLALILLVWGIMVFYAAVVMFISALLKSSTYGIIAVVAINYVVLPWSYTPHNVICRMINEVLCINSASTYSFQGSAYADLPFSAACMVFASYIALSLASVIVLSRFQKNS